MTLHQHSSQKRHELVPSALSKTLRQSNTGEAAWRLQGRMDSYIGQFLIKPNCEQQSKTGVHFFNDFRNIPDC